jgi:hypothetical protein
MTDDTTRPGTPGQAVRAAASGLPGLGLTLRAAAAASFLAYG